MPPPPVPGAAVGVWTGPAPVLGMSDFVGVLDPVARAEELAPAVVVGVLVAEPLADAELDVEEGGTLIGGVDDEDDDVHPATAAAAKMAKTPKRMAASFALSTLPGMVARIVMCTYSCARQMTVLFPGSWLQKPVSKGKTRGPVEGTDMQWRVHHWNIRLRE